MCELTLRLRVDAATLEVPARLTVATAEAACVEIAPAAVADLLAALAIHTDNLEAATQVLKGRKFTLMTEDDLGLGPAR